MHPDNVAPIALRDLRSTASPVQHARGTRWTGLTRLAARVLRAWMTGWTWYVRQGLAPAAVEPAYPFRAPARARRMLRPRVTRLVLPAAPLPVATLYDCATGAGCAA